jgi:hypothetical protein
MDGIAFLQTVDGLERKRGAAGLSDDAQVDAPDGSARGTNERWDGSENPSGRQEAEDGNQEARHSL